MLSPYYDLYLCCIINLLLYKTGILISEIVFSEIGLQIIVLRDETAFLKQIEKKIIW